jgi:cephalosporin hydroxylase
MSTEADSAVKPMAENSWSATREELRSFQSSQSRWSKVLHLCARFQNVLLDLVSLPTPVQGASPKLNEILRRAKKRSDISDHLPTLFAESLSVQPRLIVELGVRGGESAFVFERVARLTGARWVGVDLEDCSGVSQHPQWLFVQADDLRFAQEFPDWRREKGLPSEIDILFVDTTHFFEHTVQEIEHWFPLLSARAKVFFHDTNQSRFYFRQDGSIGIGWTNRGVIGALEKYFNKSFNEKEDFTDLVNGWSIKHHANCNGFTILTRVAMVESDANRKRPLAQPGQDAKVGS